MGDSLTDVKRGDVAADLGSGLVIRWTSLEACIIKELSLCEVFIFSG